jgi:hypothetical protein
VEQSYDEMHGVSGAMSKTQLRRAMFQAASYGESEVIVNMLTRSGANANEMSTVRSHQIQRIVPNGESAYCDGEMPGRIGLHAIWPQLTQLEQSPLSRLLRSSVVFVQRDRTEAVCGGHKRMLSLIRQVLFLPIPWRRLTVIGLLSVTVLTRTMKFISIACH